jgi:hypothetical protein
MTEPLEQSPTGPSSFVQMLEWEYDRIRDKLMTYIFRYHLSKYPKDLLRFWWTHEGCMPWATCQLAFEAYRAGKKPGPLYKGPPHRPQLKVIEGGRSNEGPAWSGGSKR